MASAKPDTPKTFDGILKALGLDKYQDAKMSLQEARAIPFCPLGTSTDDLPRVMLEKLMRVDNRYRDKVFTGSFKLVPFHIMDVFMLTFMSCDLLLQQMLVQKMALCRMAIPFIIPYAENKLQLPFWPLRSLIGEWVDNNGKSIEQSLVKFPMKIVSFVRLGNISLSKSKLLNKILSTTQIDTFYNRECLKGGKKRAVSNGLVEMSYNLPAKEDTSSLDDAILFFNLRGDGLLFSQQTSLLSNLSNLVICLIDVTRLCDLDIVTFLSNLQNENTTIIVLLTCKEPDSFEDDEVINLHATKHNLHIIKSYDLDAGLSFDDLALNLKDEIATSLKNKKGIVQQDQKRLFSKYDILVDEESNDILKSAISDAEKILASLRGQNIAATKHKVFPLQGKLLKDWTILLKEKHRGTGMSYPELQTEKASIDSKMNSIRRLQFEKAKLQLHMFKMVVEQALKRSAFANRIYYKCIQTELDDISRTVLPEIRLEYQEKWDEKDNDPVGLKEAALRMDESTFGTEHLFREMGQMYECFKIMSRQSGRDVLYLRDNLPKLAADFLFDGHPFELMDGDSGVVPIEWIKAVFEHLKELMEDKKMYVLSVVGLQSSGKSTLLNTMFGLELAVGAGRCTRGIYAQILKVGDGKSLLNVDYLMLLDSEGLCGINSDERFERDNEIATLVIGLADLTIVSTKGENFQQMQNILEIAVHAFLRMKAVKNFKTQKCLFLHQSISSPGAQSKLVQDRHKLQKSLDIMAKEAAEQENISATINKFSHVIDFNVKTNVFYVHDLWTGTPPMAQVKFAYSENIHELRSFIIKVIANSEYTVTPDIMKTRIEDMWNGVLSDDFLFTFKNSTSVKSYLLLEKEFYKIMRKYESDLLEFANSTCKDELEHCENIDSIEAVFCKQEKMVKDKGLEIKLQAEENLEIFFAESDYREYLRTWKKPKAEHLQESIQMITKRVCYDLECFCDLKREELSTLHNKKAQIIKQAKGLAHELKDPDYAESKIKQQFDEFWSSCETQVKVAKRTDHNVKEHMRSVLDEIFTKRAHKKYLHEEMANFWSPIDEETAKKKVCEQDVKKEYIANKNFPKDVSEVGKFIRSTHNTPGQKSRKTFFEAVAEHANKLFQYARVQLYKQSEDNIMNLRPFGHHLLDTIMMKIDDYNKLSIQESEFTLTPHYEAMVGVRIAKIISVKFEKLNTQALWIKTKTDAFKMQLFNLFKNTILEQLNQLPVDSFCDIMKRQIEQHIANDVTRKAVDKVLEKMSYTKHSLLVEVLKSLANEENFQNYMHFQEDTYTFCAKWLETKTATVLFSKITGRSEYENIVENNLHSLLVNIKQAIQKASDEVTKLDNMNKMVAFFDSFNQNMKTLLLTGSEQKFLKEQKVTDFGIFKKLLLEKVDLIHEEIMNAFRSMNSATVVWNGDSPHTQIMAQVWGCREKCPFCSAPCIYTGSKHLHDEEDHECIQHWPGGFNGTRWVEAEKLSTDICSFLVASSSNFRCSSCNNACRDSGNCKADGDGYEDHKYKEYKKYIPHWEIECDLSGNASQYWQWFMYKFQTQLSKYYGCALDVPPSWNIDKCDAIDSLKRYTEEESRRSEFKK